MKKRIVIWCGDASNQKALISKIALQYSIAGIVVEKKKIVSKKKSLFHLLFKIADRLRFRSIYQAWINLQRYYAKRFPDWPSTQVLKVEFINCNEAKEFSTQLSPDLIIVSGTNLIKEPLLNIPLFIGIVNLHTGLSPYIKGGPNCTNWCIANNDWHLVGNTVMWINAGIDSGNIITTETIDIRSALSLFEAQKIVLEHAHDLYLRVIHYLLNSNPPYISVDQSLLPTGKTFYNKMWTADKRTALLRNWKKRKTVLLKPPPQTIPLPDVNYG